MGQARVLVGVGFVLAGVAAVTEAPAYPFASGIPGLPTGSDRVYWVVTAVGYVLLGLAFWFGLTALSKMTTIPRGMSLTLRLFAIACLVLGIAYLGLLNELNELHRQRYHWGLRKTAVYDTLSMGGFCMSGLGLWVAGSMRRSRDIDEDRQGAESTMSGTN